MKPASSCLPKRLGQSQAHIGSEDDEDFVEVDVVLADFVMCCGAVKREQTVSEIPILRSLSLPSVIRWVIANTLCKHTFCWGKHIWLCFENFLYPRWVKLLPECFNLENSFHFVPFLQFGATVQVRSLAGRFFWLWCHWVLEHFISSFGPVDFHY